MMLKAILIPSVLAISALAQTPLTTTRAITGVKLADERAFGTIGITAAMAGPGPTVAGAPYSAQAVTQHIQTLSDGNRITQTSTNEIARDAQGRTRREESLPGLGNDEPPRLVMIYDPVAGQHITLDLNSKTATKMNALQGAKHMAELAMAGPPAPPPPPGAASTRAFVSTVGAQTLSFDVLDDKKSVKTDLGTQTIEGVAAKGTKITRTIPAGQIGNESPIVITSETWYSPELKILVMSKSTDPRIGETSYKLTNLSRAEPDRSLFQVPSDFTVKDQPGDMFFFRTATDKE